MASHSFAAGVNTNCEAGDMTLDKNRAEYACSNTDKTGREPRRSSLPVPVGSLPTFGSVFGGMGNYYSQPTPSGGQQNNVASAKMHTDDNTTKCW